MFAGSRVSTQRIIFAAVSLAGAIGLALVAGVVTATAPSSERADDEAAPQNEKAVRVASPYAAIKDEPAPKLFVDPPFPEPLLHGVVQIQWRVENARILPVFGKDALNVSPRVGHLHITVDDLPWHWADTSDSNTVDIVGLPPGQHKVLIELVNAEHQVFAACATCRHTAAFTIPGTESHKH